jgi:hypothetical protein
MQTMERRASTVEPIASAPALDQPVCIFAALIDSLTSPERYTLQVHNGELFITSARQLAAPVLRAEKAAA